MVAKIIQAVAGAGKTYYITHSLDNSKRYLYITYTNGNVLNLRNELTDTDKDPQKYSVITFSKFIIHWFICPFYKLLSPKINSLHGFTHLKPTMDSRLPSYKKKSDSGHYIDNKGSLYLCRLSELILSQKKELLSSMFARIGHFVDHVVIDEYQDLTGSDFNLLKLLVKQKYFDVTLVGDVYQAGVVNSLSNGKRDIKIAKYDSKMDVVEFLKNILGSQKIEIDTNSLAKSRRISKNCAEFVSKKLNINIQSKEISKSKVHVIENSNELNQVINKELDILIYDNRVKHIYENHKYITWTYSKGDTYDNVLVVLTGTTDFLIDSSPTQKDLNNTTRNKLYVALTRAHGELYIVSNKIWQKVINK